jgi:hypothetical protein
LIKLYEGLSGWTWDKGRWYTNTSVTTWQGISLSTVDFATGTRRVTKISLSGVNLKGVLENNLTVSRIPLENLEFLNELDLSGNFFLGGELPEDLYKLKYLEVLNFSNCSFVHSSGRNIPEKWGSGTVVINGSTSACFPVLKTLILSGNNLFSTGSSANNVVPASITQHPNWHSTKWNPTVHILPQRNGTLSEPVATPHP